MLIPASSCGHAGPWEEKTCHGYLCFFISQKIPQHKNSKLTCCQDRKISNALQNLNFRHSKRKRTLRSTNFHMFFCRNSNNGVVSPRNLPTLSQDASCCSLSKGLKRRPAKKPYNLRCSPQLPVRKSSKRTEPELHDGEKKTSIFEGWCGPRVFFFKKKASFYS